MAEPNITWVSNIQRVPNANVLVGTFLRGQKGRGAIAFEVSRDKKVIWEWDERSLN